MSSPGGGTTGPWGSRDPRGGGGWTAVVRVGVCAGCLSVYVDPLSCLENVFGSNMMHITQPL